MEFPQRTIEQIIDSERKMILTAPQRYGKYYDTAFEHLISASGCHYLSVGTVFADQQIGGTPDVAIGDHSGSSRSADFLTLGDLASAALGVLIAPRKYHTQQKSRR